METLGEMRMRSAQHKLRCDSENLVDK